MVVALLRERKDNDGSEARSEETVREKTPAGKYPAQDGQERTPGDSDDGRRLAEEAQGDCGQEGCTCESQADAYAESGERAAQGRRGCGGPGSEEEAGF